MTGLTFWFDVHSHWVYLASFRVVVESLADEFDVMDIAAAAVKLAAGPAEPLPADESLRHMGTFARHLAERAHHGVQLRT